MQRARTVDTFQQPASEATRPKLRLIPGGKLDLFSCPYQPGNLRLTESGCSQLFKRAQAADLEFEPQLLPCRQCEIGLKHSGAKALKPLAPRTCVRCETRGSGLRLVSRLLCVSCWNRNNEFIAQKNARGAPPSHFKTLRIYQHDSLTIIGRDPAEAKRVALRMQNYFNPDLLIDLGTASPSEVGDWWNQTVKPFARKCYQPKGPKLTATSRN